MLDQILGDLTCYFQVLVSPTLTMLDALLTLLWFLGAYKVVWDGVGSLSQAKTHIITSAEFHEEGNA